jgi:cytochrome c556
MKRFKSRLFGLLVLAATAACVMSTQGQDVVKQGKRSDFMRQKLEYSKHVLEGLAREDFPLIIESARKLKALSMAAEWEVATIPHVEEYLPLTTEFQRIADDMIKKAKARNLDGATLAFNRMTMSCVECHKYIRSMVK